MTGQWDGGLETQGLATASGLPVLKQGTSGKPSIEARLPAVPLVPRARPQRRSPTTTAATPFAVAFSKGGNPRLGDRPAAQPPKPLPVR